MFFLVSHKYKFLMGWSAKSGCSSVKHWYLDVHGVDKSQLGMPVYKAIGYANTQYTRLDWNNPGLYQDYRKYAVVRNPYSRVVSGFVNKYIIENRLPNRGWRTFNQFLQMLSEDAEFTTVDTHHFTPQFSEAYRGFERAGFEFDFVVRVESLEEGLKSICAYHGLEDVDIGDVNRTMYGEAYKVYSNVANRAIDEFDRENIPPFEYFYDIKAMKKVISIYATDFQHLDALGIAYGKLEV
jgi:Sulfotransferase family